MVGLLHFGDDHRLEWCGFLAGQTPAVRLEGARVRYLERAIHQQIRAQNLSPDEIVEKTHFSCWSAPDCRRRIEATGRDQIIVAGMEAHVCVL